MKVILDCDGVIFDSNRLKSDAFRLVLAARFDDSVVDAFIDHHQRNGGVSRFVKFRRLYTDILQRPEDEVEIPRMLGEFSARCLDLYAGCSLTDGAQEALLELARRHVLFVASGSDEAELRQVMKGRGLEQVFAGIFGSPRPKVECVACALAAAPGNAPAVMVGVAAMDVRAAKENGIPCIVMPTYSDDAEGLLALAEREGCRTIRRLTELEGVLGNRAS